MNSPSRPIQTRSQRGFTLVELMVTIGVIAALASLSVAIAPMLMDRSRSNSTSAVIQALSTAITSDGRSHFQIDVPALRTSRLLPAWDVNGDGFVDGDPQRTDAPHPDPAQAALGLPEYHAALRDVILVDLPWYRGAATSLPALVLPPERIDAWGRPLDAWGQVLRILHRDADQAPEGAHTGRHFIGIYSIGADGIDQEGAGDDLRSW